MYNNDTLERNFYDGYTLLAYLTGIFLFREAPPESYNKGACRVSRVNKTCCLETKKSTQSCSRGQPFVYL